MSVRTSTFGGVYLTDDDAARFRQQIKNPVASKAALDAVQRGREMRERARKTGRVTFTAKSRAKTIG